MIIYFNVSDISIHHRANEQLSNTFAMNAPVFIEITEIYAIVENHQYQLNITSSLSPAESIMLPLHLSQLAIKHLAVNSFPLDYINDCIIQSDDLSNLPNLPTAQINTIHHSTQGEPR